VLSAGGCEVELENVYITVATFKGLSMT